MAAPVLQLRVPETLARLDDTRGEETRSAWVLRLIDRELSCQAATPASAPAEPRTAVRDLPALPDGEPGNGAICMTPGCWQHDTRKYGLRQLPLCTACAAALQGNTYKREAPPNAARAIRRGAA